MVIKDFLAAPLIGHIKDMDDVIEISADLGGADRQAQLEQRTCDRVEQSHFIVGEGGDDRVLFSRGVVDRDARRQVLNGCRWCAGTLLPELAKYGRLLGA